jgi:hypothetical protein
MSFVTMSHVLPPPFRACARVLSLSLSLSLSLLFLSVSLSLPLSLSLTCLLLVISVALSKAHLQTHKNYVHIEYSHGASQPDTSFRQPEAVELATDMTGQPLDFSHGAKLVTNTGVASDKIPIRDSEKYLGCLATYWHPRFRSVFLCTGLQRHRQPSQGKVRLSRSLRYPLSAPRVPSEWKACWY